VQVAKHFLFPEEIWTEWEEIVSFMKMPDAHILGKDPGIHTLHGKLRDGLRNKPKPLP
jgi:hypothetical protein